jgi:hypothetical protein
VSATKSLRELVAAAARQSGSAALEREVFGSEAAEVVAETMLRFCTEKLGAPREALGYTASSACVASLELGDGRRAVVKAHRPRVPTRRLSACQAVQSGMRAAGLPAPRVLVAPAPLGLGSGTAEAYLAEGEPLDARSAAGRALSAATLAEVVAAIAPEALAAPPGPSWFGGLPSGQLWPKPHHPRFDFEAMRRGAEWIDELARRARAVPASGRRVVAHFDWRAEHLRVEAGRIVAIHDWEAVHLDAEPIAVGSAAHAFTCASSATAPPTFDEARAFVADYQAARGRAFSRDERRCIDAAWLYATAYSARCAHALGERAGAAAGYLATLSAHHHRATLS